MNPKYNADSININNSMQNNAKFTSKIDSISKVHDNKEEQKTYSLFTISKEDYLKCFYSKSSNITKKYFGSPLSFNIKRKMELIDKSEQSIPSSIQSIDLIQRLRKRWIKVNTDKLNSTEKYGKNIQVIEELEILNSSGNNQKSFSFCVFDNTKVVNNIENKEEKNNLEVNKLPLLDAKKTEKSNKKTLNPISKGLPNISPKSKNKHEISNDSVLKGSNIKLNDKDVDDVSSKIGSYYYIPSKFNQNFSSTPQQHLKQFKKNVSSLTNNDTTNQVSSNAFFIEEYNIVDNPCSFDIQPTKIKHKEKELSIIPKVKVQSNIELNNNINNLEEMILLDYERESLMLINLSKEENINICKTEKVVNKSFINQAIPEKIDNISGNKKSEISYSKTVTIKNSKMSCACFIF